MDHKQYTKISKQDRHSIIHEVLVQKRHIYEVANQFKVLPSTCKSIVNTYIKEGRIGKKENRIRKLKKVIITHTIFINPLNPLKSTIHTECVMEEVEQPSIQSKQSEERTEQQKSFDFLQRWTEGYQKEYQNRRNLN